VAVAEAEALLLRRTEEELLGVDEEAAAELDVMFASRGPI
jgi:hypothetical protein